MNSKVFMVTNEKELETLNKFISDNDNKIQTIQSIELSPTLGRGVLVYYVKRECTKAKQVYL